MVSRREFLRAGVVATVVSGASIGVSGCLSSGDSTNPSAPEPDPRIKASLVPDPVITSTAKRGENTFVAKVKNQGDRGRVHVMFYWAGGGMTNGRPETLRRPDSVPPTTISLAADAHTTVTVTPPQNPDALSGYWFTAMPLSAIIRVTNAGASGDVTVKIANGDHIIDAQTIHIPHGDTVTVPLSLAAVESTSNMSLRVIFDTDTT